MGLFDFMTGGNDGGGDDAGESVPKGMTAVSHILLASEDEAVALKARIDAGELEFADAAEQFSTCRSGPGKKGDLGMLYGPTPKLPLGLGRVWNLPYEGKEVPAFDKLVFDPATETGKVYQVSTDFGVHLVLVRARG